LSKKGLIVVIVVSIALMAAYFYFIAPREGETEGQQTSMENFPVNSTRGFTLQIGNEIVYFEFVSLEVLKDLEDMLFMPGERPNNTVIDRFKEEPFIACMKFSFRARDACFPEDPENYPEIVIEVYDEEEREWKRLMGLSSYLVIHLVTRDGDRFDIYWGTCNPPVETPVWFRGMHEDIRLHAVLSIETPEEVETYRTGDVLYVEPFELPYVKFKVEDAKFLSASEISSQLELTLRNVGSLPLIGTIDWDEVSVDFSVFPTSNHPTPLGGLFLLSNPIIVVNGEEFVLGYPKCDIPRDSKHVINLPKPGKRKVGQQSYTQMKRLRRLFIPPFQRIGWSSGDRRGR